MEPRDDVISLQDYLVVLRRQRWLIVLTTVLVVVAALGFSAAQTPLYEAHTELALERVRGVESVTLEELLAPSNAEVETEQLVVTSRPVADRVAEDLGLVDHRAALEDVRVEPVRDTRVLRIIATHPDPAAAVVRANAFASAYLDFKQDQALDAVLAAAANLDERAADLRATIGELDQAIEQAASEDERQQLSLERDALTSQLGQVISQSSDVVETSESITGGGAVLTPAELPEAPVSPQPLRTGALAVVLGLLLGVGGGFLRDYLDDVIRDESDFKRSTGGRPLLGRIPQVTDERADGRLITLIDPTALASEAYRELSAGTRFLLVTHGGPAGGAGPDDAPSRGRSIMVVSAAVGEGKSTTAANLAVAAARVGLRTVLVDADLRKASLARRFGLGRTTGLSDVLLSGDSVGDHVVDVGVDNLLVLPGGTVPPNPAELLASPAMRAVEQDLAARADLVIYDTPAVLAVPDALEVGRFVDLAIVVGRVGQTSRRQIAAAVERLGQVGTDLAGTVLNGIDAASEGYYYAYYYATNEDEAPARRSWLQPWRRRPASSGPSESSGSPRSGGPSEGQAPPRAGLGDEHSRGSRGPAEGRQDPTRASDPGAERSERSTWGSVRTIPPAAGVEPGGGGKQNGGAKQGGASAKQGAGGGGARQGAGRGGAGQGAGGGGARQGAGGGKQNGGAKQGGGSAKQGGGSAKQGGGSGKQGGGGGASGKQGGASAKRGGGAQQRSARGGRGSGGDDDLIFGGTE